ncbi:MAG: hypothetical protein RLZZ618_980 [Pseudomonadota bacterium]|jgi:predicted RNA-binding Zn-ribbon protein involved in translation (DUF1610 family)
MSNRYQCPACGFTIFNRRLATCESCKAELPKALLLSDKQTVFLDAERARVDQIRLDMALEAEALERKRERERGSGG